MARRSAVYGEALSSTGVAVPAVVERPHKGFPPERLDGIIDMLVSNADSGAMLLAKYTPMLDAMLTQLAEHVAVLLSLGSPTADSFPDLVAVAGEVSTIMERVNKMMLSSVKAKDQAVRLQKFLTGDDDKATELDNLGEIQLRRLVNEAADGFKVSEKL
jgi:hypothetical protein